MRGNSNSGILHLLLAIAWLACPAAVTRAQSPNAQLAEAREFMDKLDYEKALEALRAALQHPDNSRVDLLDTYRLMGTCLASLGQESAAEDAFARLLSIDPNYEFPTKRSPRLTAPLERARARVDRAIKATVHPAEFALRDKVLSLELQIVSDPMDMCRRVVLRHRAAGKSTESVDTFQLTGLGATVLRPPVQQPAAWIDYYLVITDRWGGVLFEIGSANRPLRLTLEAELFSGAQPSPWYKSWWFWTLVGGAALAAAGTTTYLLWPGPPDQVDVGVRIHGP